MSSVDQIVAASVNVRAPALQDLLSPATRWTLHRANGEAIPAAPGDASVRTFLERLVREGRSLEGADLDRLARDLQHDGAHGLLNEDGLIDLKGAKLRGGDLRGIKATQVDLTLADLSSAWIDDADLTGVTMPAVDLRGTRARRARLAEADLQGANLGEDEDPPALPASIRFPAKEDAGRRGNRFLGDGIVLSGAGMDRATLKGTQLTGGQMTGTKLRDATVEDANLDGARVSRLDLSRSTVLRSSIVTESAHEVIATHALLRNNAYARVSGFKEALLHPARLIHMGRDERAQRALMPVEMRKDYDGSAVVAAISSMALPMAMGATHAADKLADKGMEGIRISATALSHAAPHIPGMASAVPHGLLEGFGSAAAGTLSGGAMGAEWLGSYATTLMPMVPSVAIGIGGAWILKKAIDASAEPIVRGVLERVNTAREFLGEGKPMTALACLVGWGTAATRIREAIVNDAAEDDWAAFFSGQGTVTVVGDHTRLKDLLGAAGLLDTHGRLPSTAVGVHCEGGPGWPKDKAPQSICIHPFGTGCVATWEYPGGALLRRVHYDAEGRPGLVTMANGSTHDASRDPVEFFRQQRDPIAEFMDGVRRMVAPHDGLTHVAKDGGGGVIVRRLDDGRIDNPIGPAVVTADGDTRFFLDGASVPGLPREPTPEAALEAAGDGMRR